MQCSMLRWHAHLSAKVNKNANLGYSQRGVLGMLYTVMVDCDELQALQALSFAIFMLCTGGFCTFH